MQSNTSQYPKCFKHDPKCEEMSETLFLFLVFSGICLIVIGVSWAFFSESPAWELFKEKTSGIPFLTIFFTALIAINVTDSERKKAKRELLEYMVTPQKVLLHGFSPRRENMPEALLSLEKEGVKNVIYYVNGRLFDGEFHPDESDLMIYFVIGATKLPENILGSPKWRILSTPTSYMQQIVLAEKVYRLSTDLDEKNSDLQPKTEE